MDAAGRLKLYAGNRIIWSSRSEASPGAVLSVEDDESVLISQGDRQIWSSNSCVPEVPRPQTPADTVGTLQIGSACDEIDFRVIYGKVPAGETGFALNLVGDVTWWKAVEIPVGTSDYKGFQRGGGGQIATYEIDKSRPIRFLKAMLFGIPALLSVDWDVLTAVPDGAQILFEWKRDHC